MSNVNCKSERDSNIELLRIIAMVFIVAGHLIGQGHLTQNVSGITGVFIGFLASGARISVNIFLIIGTWFMCDSQFKAQRVLRLYSEVFLYSAVITTLMLLIGKAGSLLDVIRGFFVIYGYPLWFASSYIVLLLISPYLNLLFKLDKKNLFRLILIISLFLPVMCTIYPNGEFNYVCDTLWFIVVYIYIGYYKRYIHNHITNRQSFIMGTGGCLIYILFLVLKYIKFVFNDFPGGNKLYEISCKYLADIKTIPNFLCAFFIFVFFLHINIGKKKSINYIAGSAFAVYIIHQVPAFYPFLWNSIFKCDKWPRTFILVGYTLGAILLIYVVCLIIDKLRVKFVEPLLFNSKQFKRLCNILDSYYEDI